MEDLYKDEYGCAFAQGFLSSGTVFRYASKTEGASSNEAIQGSSMNDDKKAEYSTKFYREKISSHNDMLRVIDGITTGKFYPL